MDLTIPTDITAEHLGSDANTVTVTWVENPANPANAEWHFRFVKKTDPTNIVDPQHAPVITAANGSNRASAVITIDANKGVTVDTLLKEYFAEVQVTTATEQSDWGSQIHWIVKPSLTVTIGSHEFTLTHLPHLPRDVYELPVSKEHPLTITYQDIKDFAATLSLTSLPDTWPDGTSIDSSVQISKLVVATERKLFSLAIALVANWTLFPGLTINQMGLELARTDGTNILQARDTQQNRGISGLNGDNDLYMGK